jgi:hypothetical protein
MPRRSWPYGAPLRVHRPPVQSSRPLFLVTAGDSFSGRRRSRLSRGSVQVVRARNGATLMSSKQSEAVRRRWEAARLAMVQPEGEEPDDESWGDLTAEPREVDYLETEAGGRPAMWAVPKRARTAPTTATAAEPSGPRGRHPHGHPRRHRPHHRVRRRPRPGGHVRAAGHTHRSTGEHLVGPARIEVATVCLGGSRTSFVLRAAGSAGQRHRRDRRSVRRGRGRSRTCTAGKGDPFTAGCSRHMISSPVGCLTGTAPAHTRSTAGPLASWVQASVGPPGVEPGTSAV